MNRQYLLAAVVAVGVFGTVGVGSAVAGVGPAADLLAGDEHELRGFHATDPQCANEFSTNSSTAITNGGGETTITHTQNISLSNAGVTIGEPTFDRSNETTYVLNVPTTESDRPAAQCIAFARYEASMQIPVEDGPWTIVVEHDNETTMTLSGDSNSTTASGSASASVQGSG